VDTLLEGSVRKAGDRLRITAQLVNVSDGYHLWSERYDRRLDDVFAVQDEIARAIVEKLKVKLVGPKEAPLVKRASANLEAYQLYLEGRYHFARRYKGGLERAVDCFTRAVDLDPDSAPALAGLADAYSLHGFYGLSRPREVLPRARQAAERAVELDDSLAEAHHSLGMVHLWLDWNWEAIERGFTRARALDPKAPLTHAFYALSLAVMGRSEESAREADQAKAHDPLSAFVFFLSGVSYYFLHRFDRSIEDGERAFALDPGCVAASFVLCMALAGAGRHDEAIEAGERVVLMTDRMPYFVAILGTVLGVAGRRDAARQALDELLERSRHGYVAPMLLAMVHAGLGEVAEGIAILEQDALDRGGACVPGLVGPIYDALQSHPRFGEMLRSVGYTGPWASLAGTGAARKG
jgi:serine/threonine-protein kinase